MVEGGDETDASTIRGPTNAFVDTCVLLNYAQRAIERDLTSALIESDDIDIVVGVTVAEELEDVTDRRSHIYADFVNFLLEDDTDSDTYDPANRRPYFQENDLRHVRNIQMALANVGNRAEVQRQLRYVIRSIERRLQYLLDEVIPSALFEKQPGLPLLFALHDVIPNDKDRSVVGDAALWAAEGEDSSRVFVTMDRADLADVAEDINTVLRDVKDDAWTLIVVTPSEIPGGPWAADVDTHE